MNSINTEVVWKSAVAGLGIYLLAQLFLGIGGWIQAPMLLDIGQLLRAIAYLVFIVCGVVSITLFLLRQLQ
jgi:hypothetical protein